MQAARTADQRYGNWVKDTLAQLYLKEGLEVFVDQQANAFHYKLKSAIGGQRCTCTWRDLVRGKRTWEVKNCPSSTCQSWLGLILSHHRNRPFPQLTPENTDPARWPTDYWEVMKVYQPRGCRDQHSAKEADVAGILTTLNKCDHFGPFIANMNDIDDLLQLRNRLMHSSDYLVKTVDMTNDLQLMLQFLRGLKSLSPAENQPVQTAIDKIEELRANKIDISLNRELELKAIRAKQAVLESTVGNVDRVVQTNNTVLKTHHRELQTHKHQLNTHQRKLQANKTDIQKPKREHQIHKRQLQTHDVELQTHKKKLKTHDVELQTHKKKLKTHDVELQTHKKKLKTHDVELQTHKKKLKTHDVELQTHEKKLKTHDVELQTHEKKLKTHDVELQTHEKKLKTHDVELQAHEKKLKTHDVELQTHEKKLKTHDVELQAHEKKLKTHDGELQAHKKKLKTHDGELQTHQKKLKTHDVELQAHEKKLKTHDGELQAHKKKLKTHDGELQTHQKKLKTHDVELQAHEKKLKTHDGELQTHKKKLKTHDVELQTHEKKLKTHDVELQTNKKKLKTHDSQLQIHQRQLQTHHGDLQTHRVELDNHDKRLSTCQTEQQSNQSQLQAHQTNLDDQNTRLLSCQTELKSHHQKLTTLEERMETPETDNGSVEITEADIVDLRTSMIQHYRQHCLKVPNPVVAEEIGMNEIYVRPDIKVLRETKNPESGLVNVRNRKAPANESMCKQLFYTEDYKNKQIYVTSDAGMGKTLFCKHLTNMWCSAHTDACSGYSDQYFGNETYKTEEFCFCTETDTEETDTEEEIDFSSESDTEEETDFSNPENIEDEVNPHGRSIYHNARTEDITRNYKMEEENCKILLDFRILFYITLRDTMQQYSIAEMIETQILRYIKVKKTLKASDILENEGCLVIIDGLDEWTCPEDADVPHFVHPGIPGRLCSNRNTVYLITTRPWKFDVLNLTSSDVDKHVELVGLNPFSTGTVLLVDYWSPITYTLLHTQLSV